MFNLHTIIISDYYVKTVASVIILRYGHCLTLPDAVSSFVLASFSNALTAQTMSQLQHSAGSQLSGSLMGQFGGSVGGAASSSAAGKQTEGEYRALGHFSLSSGLSARFLFGQGTCLNLAVVLFYLYD